MSLNLKKFQMVTIDHPITSLDDNFCSQMLGKSLKMKIDGYNSTYSDRVLPLDKADFFGTHLIFCERVEAPNKEDELVPIFSYKAAPYDRCLKYNFEFPAITSVKNDAHPSCLADINTIIQNVADPSLVSFDSSWAQNVNYRFANNPALKEHLREIMMMVIVMHHIDFNHPHMITCGVSKVKTDLFFLKMGLKKLNENSHYLQKSMDNEELVIFHGTKFSDEAYAMAEKYSDIWNNRLVVDGLRNATKLPRVA